MSARQAILESMSYCQFSVLSKALEAFDLSLQEQCFFPNNLAVSPSTWLTDYLATTLPLASAGSEKARSEGLIYPQKQTPVSAIYGSVSNGTLWRFLRLMEHTITLDLLDYPLRPIDQILGFLVWMAKEEVSQAQTQTV